jgi:aspartate/tyrosine/aromatic aminotransferase
MKSKQLLPLFDFPYQGFATGVLDLEAYPVRLFLSEGIKLNN